MSELTLEREEAPDWVRLPLLTEDSGEILLVSQEGGQLALPAPVLLAVSRSLATILHTNPLLSVVTPAVSLPVGLECLKAFKEILLFGRVKMDLNDEKVNLEELFFLLDIEAKFSTSVKTTSNAASAHTTNHCEARDDFSVAYNADSQFIKEVDKSGNNYSPPPSPSQFLEEEESIVDACVEEIGLKPPALRLSNNNISEMEDQNHVESPEKVLRRSSRKTRLQNICEKLSGRLNAPPTIKRVRGVARIAGPPGLRGRSARHLLQGRGGQNKSRDFEKANKDLSKENLNDINEEFHGFPQSEVNSMLDVQKEYRNLLRPCHTDSMNCKPRQRPLRRSTRKPKEVWSTKSPQPLQNSQEPRAEVEPRFDSANEDVDVFDGPSQLPPISETPRVFSNNRKDFCKVECKICGAVKQISCMYSHVKRTHKMRIQDYKAKYGRFTEGNLLTTVYHRCGVCNLELLFDSQFIASHVIAKHNLSLAAYTKQFLEVNASQNGLSSQSPPVSEQPRVFSNNRKDFCKIECKICGDPKVKEVSAMQSHLKLVHKMKLRDYKAKYGRFTAETLLTTVYHRCGVCSKELLFHSRSLSRHVPRHNMSVAAYSKQFLDVDYPPVGQKD